MLTIPFSFIILFVFFEDGWNLCIFSVIENFLGLSFQKW